MSHSYLCKSCVFWNYISSLQLLLTKISYMQPDNERNILIDLTFLDSSLSAILRPVLSPDLLCIIINQVYILKTACCLVSFSFFFNPFHLKGTGMSSGFRLCEHFLENTGDPACHVVFEESVLHPLIASLAHRKPPLNVGCQFDDIIRKRSHAFFPNWV